jgi:hypothetical protein
MRLAPDVLFEFIPQFLRDGWQVVRSVARSLYFQRLMIYSSILKKIQNVHAIGDRANGIVLDAFEVVLKGVNVTALRPRLEHAQLMTKEDMRRLGRLGGESTLLSLIYASYGD